MFLGIGQGTSFESFKMVMSTVIRLVLHGSNLYSPDFFHISYILG